MSRADNTTLPTTSLPIRMRVHGMDCAKDAAEMEKKIKEIFTVGRSTHSGFTGLNHKQNADNPRAAVKVIKEHPHSI